jgi:hypothetical protein
MEGMKRPEVVVLPDSALVPSNNRVSPPPNQFTHEVTRAQPFYFAYQGPDTVANGEFQPGTKVVLLVYESVQAMCHVVDSRGLYVQTSWEGLARL